MCTVILDLSREPVEVLKEVLEKIRCWQDPKKSRLTILVTNQQEKLWREAGYDRSFYYTIKDAGCSYWYYSTQTSDAPGFPALISLNVVPTCVKEKVGTKNGQITITEAIERRIAGIGIKYGVLTTGPFTTVDITEAIENCIYEVEKATELVTKTVRGEEELVAAGTTETGTTVPTT